MPRRKPAEANPFEQTQWPEYTAQQRLQALQDPAEIAAAQHRAQVLITQGWEPLADWLDSPITPAEQQALARQQQAQQDLVDVFD